MLKFALFALVILVFTSIQLLAVKVDPSKFAHPIDENVQYAVLHPFVNEWKELINHHEHPLPSPFHFWFKCIDNQVRGYLFVEDIRELTHGKEANVPTGFILGDKLKMFADGHPIKIRNWLGGLDFYFNVTTPNSMMKIMIQGLQHYTHFDASKCIKSKPDPKFVERPQYIMHIHLRQHFNASHNVQKVAKGIANHAYYHRCALHLDRYEFVVHKEQVDLFLAYKPISKAVEEGWMHMIVRNPIIPAPIHIGHHSETDCYWQAYVENLALLRHWKENARMYFFDSDEYVWFADNYTTKSFFDTIHKHPVVAFERFMTFCKTCSNNHAELKQFSLKETSYRYVKEKLNDPKLVVDPNEAGCYIVHWAGCGPDRHYFPIPEAKILHFENLYVPRWQYSHELIVNGLDLTPSNVNTFCDPKHTIELPHVPLYKRGGIKTRELPEYFVGFNRKLRSSTAPKWREPTSPEQEEIKIWIRSTHSKEVKYHNYFNINWIG